MFVTTTRRADRVRLAILPSRSLGRSRPASCLVGEACVGPAHVIRRAANGVFDQISDPFLQDAVGGQTDRIFDPLGFVELIDFGICEAGVGSEVDVQNLLLVSRHDWLQHRIPPVGAVDVAGTQRASFQITELAPSRGILIVNRRRLF
jgi:hypothetical protein